MAQKKQLQEIQMTPCHKNERQNDDNINPKFLKELTEKYQQANHDRKSCYMCVEPIDKQKFAKIGDAFVYPSKKERCPNMNTGKSIFTGPKGEKWPGNKIIWKKTPTDTDGGHPLVKMANKFGKLISKQYRINNVFKDPCGTRVYDHAFGVCWYAWIPVKTIQANKKKDLTIVHDVNTNSHSIQKANDAVFGDPYPFDDGYYGYNGDGGYGHYQLNGINTHDQYNNVLMFGIGIVMVMMMLFCVCAVLIGISMVSFAVGNYWHRCFKPTSKNNTVGNHNAFIENDLDQV
eukprot:293098_1